MARRFVYFSARCSFNDSEYTPSERFGQCGRTGAFSMSSMFQKALFAISWMSVMLGAPAVAPAGVDFTGNPVQEYRDAGDVAMNMPTDVAVAADGAVVVADGVNDRLVQFTADGRFAGAIEAVGDARLLQPLTVAYDGQANLWICDAGNRRIVVRAADGSLLRRIDIPAPPAGDSVGDPAAAHATGFAADPTDMVPAGDGTSAWIVDNDNHRLVRWDPSRQEAFTSIGGFGEALSQFKYPFMAAGDDSGRLFVSDSLNGRVEIVKDGRFIGVVGRYGVEPGDLYRPKGIAIDTANRVWVADGVMGVVQAFEPTGRFLGVLRDGAGQPMRFSEPTGIAFGADGDLYVVELSANRVRRVSISERPRPAELPGPARERAVGGGGASPACTICHIEWFPTLADDNQTPIFTLPEARADYPIVSRSWMCLSCHDGSVADSRRKVWVEHGHQTDIVPPEDIKVPDYLPLVDSMIKCRTCHSAHAGDNVNQSLAEMFFVRAEGGSGELCISCHGNKALGPAAGAHPVGGMPWAVPDALIEAGAQVGPNPRELTCYVCHTPHGSHRHDLLVMGTESSQLCLTCHKKLRPGLWRPGEHEHPQNPPLENDAQRQAIAAMGTKVGDNDTLICLSCHVVHHGVSDRYLLADTLHDSSLCVRCHPGRVEMFDTAHDLRHSAPQCRNRIGQTAEDSGPCGACHTFHRYARMPDPMPRDPTGLCTTCHQQNQCAGKVDWDAPSHPIKVRPERLPDDLALHTFDPPAGQTRTLACLTCHDPHETGTNPFLVMPQAELCSTCHGETAASLGGAHTFAGAPDITNAKGKTPAEAGECGFCHAMHEAKGPVLWIATDQAPATADGLCTQCHRDNGIAAEYPESRFHHPTGPETADEAGRLTTMLPLYDISARQSNAGYVACGSCHDPHADSKATAALLRAGPPASALCTDCHGDVAVLEDGWHDIGEDPSDWPPPSQAEGDLCLSCHQPHSNDPARGLWTVMPNQNYALADGVCLGCHEVMQWGGHGTSPAEPHATQPADQAATTAGYIENLPLVPTGPGRRGGAVGCKTCHDPHGPPGEPPHLLRAGHADDPGAMCMACHTDLQYIGLSLHSRRQMERFAAENPGQVKGQMLSCGPCHSVHMGEAATKPAQGPLAHLPADVRQCVGCHREGGGATTVEVIEHFAPLTNVQEPGTPGFMPLVNAEGRIGRTGRIGCVTCHDPHGREPGPAMAEVDPEKMTEDKLRAMMPMVRRYVAPNLCSSCHGFDGLMRYLYWHEPEKRREGPAR